MEAALLGFAASFAANLLSSITVEVFTFLAKNTKALKFDPKVEVEKLKRELVKAKESFDNLKTTETWQLQTAEVFGVLCDIEDLINDTRVKGKSGGTKKKIKHVRKRLERITTTLEVGNTAQQQNQQSAVDETLKIPKNIVGRKEEMEKIVKLLLDDTSRRVIIVGMGGLGKTVLAWHTVKDSRILEKFHVKWVPMSAEFDLNVIAKSILNPRLKSEYPPLLPDDIWDLFKAIYAGENVLIVLDGLRDVKGEDWTSFSDLFLGTSVGCKVLITTRNPQVASNTGSIEYNLPFMRDEDCQELVIQSALKNKNLDSRQVKILEDIAGAIAQMSRGLPVAASNLGHFLSSNCRDDDWMNLKDKYICDTMVFQKEIFPKLKLNTANMSFHLIKCLAFCSLFPRNYHFNRDSLVELWVAAGFIPPQEKRSLREIGNEYFDDLYSRSFFQPSQLGEHAISRQSSYKMHEFIHNFAQFIASSLCFRLEDIKDFSSHRLCNKVRHLSLLCTSSVPLDLQELLQCDGLRTILLPTEHSMKFGQIPHSFFVKLGRLKVLDLSHTDVVKIHESLGELKLLQYLDLSKTNIELLPKSISKLYGLQVLKLRGCTKLLQLPTDLYNLTSLVNLEVDIQCLASKDASVGRLIYLQKLPKFFVGKEKGSCITELKNLKFLRGTLNLLNLENVEDETQAREANLSEKESLRRLELEWSNNIPDEARAIAIDVIAGLEPHRYVKELKLTNYVGSSFPTWLTSQSCRLVSIYVQDCSLDDVLPTLGQLPFLENLHLKGMHRVTEMRNPACGDGAYPSLKSLEIIHMRSLTTWHELPENCMLKLSDLKITKCPSLISMQSLNPLCSLQTLEIKSCPVLEALPQLPPSVQSLIILDSDMVVPECYRIKSIPSVEIDYQKVVSP